MQEIHDPSTMAGGWATARRLAVGLLLAASLASAQEPAVPSAPTPPSPPVEEGPALRVLRTGGLRVETAALIMSGQEGGPVLLAALPLLFPGGGERVRVPVLVEVDGSALLAGQAESTLRFEVSLYAVSGPGSVAGSLIQTIEVDLARLGDAVEKSGVKFVGELSLLPGDYSLRVLVRNMTTGNMGLRIVPLAVPALRGAPPALLPPLFSEPEGAWLAALAVGAGQPAAPPALLEGGGLPAARPILSLGHEAAFELPAYGLPADAELRLEVKRRGGDQAADLPVRVVGRRAGALPGLEIVSAAFEPRDLEQGEYLVRAVVPGSPASSAATAVILAQGGAGGRVWAEFTGERPTGPRAEAPPAGEQPAAAPARRRRRIDAKPVEAAYRAALARLATGEEDAARAAVAELEAPLLSGPEPVAPEDLAEIEMKIAADLARTDPESLVPVLMLYERLYLEYRGRRLYLGSTHSWEMVFRLADLYAEQGGSAAARQLAARFLVGLGMELVKAGPGAFRERPFEGALAFEADNEAALLALAVDAERHGEYKDAVGYLERLAKSRPESREARVRLAVNLARLGKDRESRRLFEEIVAKGDGAASMDWTVALAYHELARALITQGSLAEAERLLKQGLARLPGDEKLLVQLALLSDLRRQPGQARAVLDGIEPGANGPTASARHRYNQLPVELFEATWKELERSVAARLPSLAAATRSGTAPVNLP